MWFGRVILILGLLAVGEAQTTWAVGGSDSGADPEATVGRSPMNWQDADFECLDAAWYEAQSNATKALLSRIAAQDMSNRSLSVQDHRFEIEGNHSYKNYGTMFAPGAVVDQDTGE